MRWREGPRKMHCWGIFFTSIPLLVTLTVSAGEVSSTQPPHVLLLVDTWSPMATQDRLHKVHVALKGWIIDEAPEGIKISLWKFADDASLLSSTFLRDNPGTRQEIANHIPWDINSHHCISCSIETVLKNITQNTTILLITAGDDKFFEEDLPDLSLKLSKYKCSIISAIIGDSKNMHVFEELSYKSVNYIPDSNAVFGLLDVLERSFSPVKNRPSCNTVIEEETFPNVPEYFFQFNIDSLMANSAVCIKIYSWPNDTKLNLTHVNTANKLLLNFQLKDNYTKYCLDGEKVGVWKIHMQSPTYNKFAALRVTACKQKGNSSVTLSCWVQKESYHLLICGFIHAGNNTIREVNTSIDIFGQNGTNTYLQLKPISPEAKNTFQQKCLSVRNYYNLTQTNYYAVRCRAAGQFSQGIKSSPLLEHFTRISWGGTFSMNESLPESSLVSRITDLSISCTNGNGIILEFTVPKNALKYRLSISTSLYSLLAEADFLLGTVPGHPGKKETIKFLLPSKYVNESNPLYIGIKGSGENEVMGEISNIVVVSCHYSALATEEETDSSTTETPSERNKNDLTTNSPLSNPNKTQPNVTLHKSNHSKIGIQAIPNEKNGPSVGVIIVLSIIGGIIIIIIATLYRIYYVRSKKRSGTYYVQCKYNDTEGDTEMVQRTMNFDTELNTEMINQRLHNDSECDSEMIQEQRTRTLNQE